MSLVKVNSAQIGQSATATQNFTLAVPASPDGTVKLARGNSGATTQDVLTVDASGNVNAPVGLQQGGVATGRMVLGTSQATTSGTAIDFTGIPSWVKKITVMLNGVSTNGISPPIIQIGSGSITTTGYLGATSNMGTGVITANFTTGVAVAHSVAATSVYRGLITLVNISGSTWVGSVAGAFSDGATSAVGASNVTLSGTLDRIRLTTVNGTDTFDAGAINILYEG